LGNPCGSGLSTAWQWALVGWGRYFGREPLPTRAAMAVEHATMADSLANGIDLSSNAFMLIHGWTAGPLLLEFVAKFLRPLSKKPMTPAELAAETEAEEGPLAILLRTCAILEYVEFNPTTSMYSVNRTEELDELDNYLRPTTSTAKAIAKLYAEAIPPFQVPSEEATECLVVWAEQRPEWKKSKSQALSILLDGIVLAPLLTSITYFARWNEDGLDYGKDSAMERFDFSKLDSAERQSLGDIFDELGVGTMSTKGIVTLSSKGSLALQRCYSYYVPTSYSPMLSEFNTILFEDPGWGFVGAGQDAEETEIHVERTLNVVGSGAQHTTLFKDLMKHITTVFSGDNYGSQPAFVVDVGCGDGKLLMTIYEHVKAHTQRGEHLTEYPLTMVGVDFNEEARVTTAVNLSKEAVPHLVLFGDIGDPAKIMAALKKKSVDLSKTLHVRSFLDHDRPYIPPKTPIDEDSVVGTYVKKQLADFVHLDKHGKPIAPLDLFGSLVEHFQRWGDAIDGSAGLCMLEAMMLDVPTTKRFLNDCVSFHFDIVQCLSRQYVISPPSFAMGAAMAGLLPANVKSVQTYPEEGKYCRMLNQHLVRKQYRIRFAEPSDMETLLVLEAGAWKEEMRASEEVLRRRLETSPTTNLVAEMDGKVIAVLYMQLVQSIDAVDEQKFMQISDSHSPAGGIVQLIAICSDKEWGHLGAAFDLRNFALHLARIDPSIESVIGVTRCKDFGDFQGTMQSYVDKHVAGELTDSIIDFHTSFGAKVVKLVRNFRPEDTDNNGIGVLIQYDVKSLGAPLSTLGGNAAEDRSVVPSVDIICALMDELGYPSDKSDLHKGFFDYGMDSLELVRIRNKLSSTLATELPATLLLDYPTVADLAHQLDKDRGIEGDTKALKDTDKAEDEPSGWDNVGIKDLLEILEKEKSIYSLPTYQKKFTDMAKKCYPDMLKYILMIETVIAEVEGAIFEDRGLIEDQNWRTVQRGRGELTNVMMKYWAEVPELRVKSQEIMHLTKQDQVWT